MLFQNQDSVEEPQMKTISIKTDDTSSRRSLINTLPCQKLVKIGKFGGRGQIPQAFSPGLKIDFSRKNDNLSREYHLWILARRQNMASTDVAVNIPSFAAMKSLLISDQHPITACAYTPILPYPATQFDTIFTTMINFQDVLSQKGQEYGPLWSDEGVYRIAKEIQLRHPDKFDNIFLGIGGFHLEKVVISCLGVYLESSGIDSLMVEEEIFGPEVIGSVMNGGNYVRGKRGMFLISEAMEL